MFEDSFFLKKKKWNKEACRIDGVFPGGISSSANIQFITLNGDSRRENKKDGKDLKGPNLSSVATNSCVFCHSPLFGKEDN